MARCMWCDNSTHRRPFSHYHLLQYNNGPRPAWKNEYCSFACVVKHLWYQHVSIEGPTQAKEDYDNIVALVDVAACEAARLEGERDDY